MRPLPGKQEVHVWRVPLTLGSTELEALAQVLAPDEHQRAARFHFARDRDRYIVAHGRLRLILARYLDVSANALSFSAGQFGKPSLVGGDGISFNLSHSGELALVAVTSGFDVGVDVEAARQVVDIDGVARQVFPQSQLAELRRLPPAARRCDFYTLWTLFEACMKAAGAGLSMDSRAISLAPTRRSAVTPAVGSMPSRTWALRPLQVADGYKAAVALATDAQIVYLD